MKPAEYEAFTRDLQARLAADPRVLGLILLGSTAATHHAPDAWSDHDFFVVVQEGQAEALRASTDWLPPFEPIALHHRDTKHGAKVVYAGGHLLEYAVFTPDELELSRNHHARVVLDKLGDLPERLAPTLETAEPDVSDALNRLYAALLVGIGREARGEHLSAHLYLRSHALTELLTLLAARRPGFHPHLRDARNPSRRVEQTHPREAADLRAALDRPALDAAERLLDLAEQWAGAHPAWNAAITGTLRAALAGARQP